MTCVFIAGPRQLLPNWLQAATPILPTSFLRGCQWRDGRRRPSPSGETLRWSGQEVRPCSSQKSQDVRALTDDPVAGQTSQRSKSQPSCLSTLQPTTFIRPKPTPPISFSQPKTHLQYLHLQVTPSLSFKNRLHNPETNTKVKTLFRTPSCLERTWGTCIWITRQSSGKNPEGINISFSQKGPILTVQPRHRQLSPTSPLT